MSVQRTTRDICRCSYPTHLGKCLKCQLTHKEVSETCLRALDLLHRFWLQGDISWEERERLTENIDHLVWVTVNQLYGELPSQNLLVYFQNSIYDQVRALLRRKHQLELTEQDEEAFRNVHVDLDELLDQMRFGD